MARILVWAWARVNHRSLGTFQVLLLRVLDMAVTPRSLKTSLGLSHRVLGLNLACFTRALSTSLSWFSWVLSLGKNHLALLLCWDLTLTLILG